MADCSFRYNWLLWWDRRSDTSWRRWSDHLLLWLGLLRTLHWWSDSCSLNLFLFLRKLGGIDYLRSRVVAHVRRRGVELVLSLFSRNIGNGRSSRRLLLTHEVSTLVEVLVDLLIVGKVSTKLLRPLSSTHVLGGSTSLRELLLNNRDGWLLTASVKLNGLLLSVPIVGRDSVVNRYRSWSHLRRLVGRRGTIELLLVVGSSILVLRKVLPLLLLLLMLLRSSSGSLLCRHLLSARVLTLSSSTLSTSLTTSDLLLLLSLLLLSSCVD